MMGYALITGGSSGIGLEYARQLAERGYGLVLVSNQEEQLREAATELGGRFGVPVEWLYLDLSAQGCAQKMLEFCDGKGLEVDILINNAGIFFIEYLGSHNLEKARTMVGLHVTAVTECCILFGERMKARGAGRILIMSSMTADIPAPGIAVYSASKAYLKSFGLGLSYELAPYEVTVTTILPAAVDTGLYNLSPRMRKTGRRLGLVLSPEKLVRKALRAMFHGRRIRRPGALNLTIPFLVRLLPSRLIDRLGMKYLCI
ncbi:MAG: SDR family NAD(P)-dependent oxidoreductase [Bacteroidales bacterium]|nr:SDR family NAD(P)-dependent oxidoreductase [Bacteroidales bacterium]